MIARFETFDNSTGTTAELYEMSSRAPINESLKLSMLGSRIISSPILYFSFASRKVGTTASSCGPIVVATLQMTGHTAFLVEQNKVNGTKTF